MMDATRDVATQNELRDLEDVLWEWTVVIERTVRAWASRKDVPWWYNERASLSMFAGAIWRAGGIAFEEFSTERAQPGNRSSVQNVPSKGRADLQFSYRGTEFVAEVKQCWPMIGQGAKSAEADIDWEFKEAEQQLATLAGEAKRKLSVVFCAPCFPESQKSSWHDRLPRWQAIVRSVRSDAYASFWLPERDYLVDAQEHYIYPGAGVFIRELSKSFSS